MKDNVTVLAGSHLPVLLKLMNLTRWSVLEMGMGFNSTPVLHWLCHTQKRYLLSIENDPKWYEMNKYYAGQYHDVILLYDWDKAPILERYWEVALIDHRPALRRRIDAKKLMNNAKYVVLHDSEPEIDRFYRYSSIYQYFKYRYDYTKVKPHTTVLSNFTDLSHLENSL